MDPKMTAAEAADFLNISIQGLHKQLRSKGIPFKKAQNRIYFSHSSSRELLALPFQRKIISFQIVKGGTGKTSLAHSIAVRANLYGAKVLCVDLDQQANLTQSFNIDANEQPVMIDILKEKLLLKEGIVEVYEGLHLLPSRIENAILDNHIMLSSLPLNQLYVKLLAHIKEDYDLILIDCPPALGQSVAAATLASDTVIAPVTPEEFSLSGLNLSIQEIKNIEENYGKNIPFRLVLNKFDTRTSLSHEVLSSLIKHPLYSDKIFRSYIRISQEFPNAISKGITIFDTLKMTSAKEDVDLLTKEIIGANLTEINQEVTLGKLDTL